MSTTRPGGGRCRPDRAADDGERADTLVVGIGASAGGLEAFSRLLGSLPADSGMAFVLVQHLDPQHPSLLSSLLAGRTAMPVHEATDGAQVVADNVYVVPPAQDLLVEGGRLRLRARDPDAQPHLPIDYFLRSLALDKGERAIGVVLSGAASDGVRGLAAIKCAGGLTFAQDPSSAEYPSMPSSAIGARVVDLVLPPEEIALELARLGAGVRAGHLASPPTDAEGQDSALEAVFALLRDAFGVDFSAYKLPTIRRRIARRMLVRRVADLREYVGLLRDEPTEVEALYRDILIIVNEFFREPETFAALRERVFPAILEGKDRAEGVRIWVPGCASGEEAYSLAITLLEVMDAQGVETPVKIFATDISEPDLATARRGLYAESISSAVPSDLLARYFVRTAGGYQIRKGIRELCVFARHDVTRDPPFPNLDLVSCRNLLIYLGPALQRWVIPSLHYGLRPDGYLVLGRSESTGGFTELFEVVDKKQKIFRKVSSPKALLPLRPEPPRRQAPPKAGRTRAEGNGARYGGGARAGRPPDQAAEPSEADQLRAELGETRQRLEAVIQGQEAANEELRATNEELLASSEETQSMNEELETTQEELQSTNQELRANNLELGEVKDDLSNLLTSVHFPIIMVGRDLGIRRFTPSAARLFKLIPGDVGRPITDLRLRIDVPDLEQILAEVIETTSLIEREVKDNEGRWYAMQVRPYKTLDNRIDGAVITLFDIDEMKRLLAAQRNLATILQQHYLHELPEIPGLELAVVTETAHDRELVGGDFHDVFSLPDRKIIGIIGDVAGKGVEAAGLADTVRIAVRATALISSAPDDILRNVHRLVASIAGDFVTALILAIHPSTGEVIIASAGHPPPLLLSAAGCELVEPRFGLPLGSMDSDYPPLRITMSRGDALVLYTDGLIEARRNGELFGEGRLLGVMRSDATRDPQSLVSRARDAAVEFGGQLTDDLQVLALRLS